MLVCYISLLGSIVIFCHARRIAEDFGFLGIFFVFDLKIKKFNQLRASPARPFILATQHTTFFHFSY
jgi:hypothetical protein